MAEPGNRRGDVGRLVGGRAGRVRSTGIALVRKGELFFPEAGSAAQAERVIADSQAVIHYHFPVEVEIRVAGDAQDPQEALSRLLDELSSFLDNR